MTGIIVDLIAPYWQAIAGVLAAGLAFVGIYFKGRSDQKQKAKLEDITNANEIRKAGADARAGVDPDRMHDDGWRRD